LNIQELEEHGVMKTNYIFNMPDPVKKLTLCAYPQKVTEKPDKFEAVHNGMFWMVNRQHCMAASKRMQLMDSIPSEKKEKFKKWECFVVWNKEDGIIRKISAYYNRVNHFENFMPNWATNILAARFVYTNMGSPTPPKEPTELGKMINTSKKTKNEGTNIRLFNVSSGSLARVELNTFMSFNSVCQFL